MLAFPPHSLCGATFVPCGCAGEAECWGSIAQGGNGELDCVESLRESGHGEAVQAEAEVVNGKGLAVSRNSDLEADSRDLSSCYTEQALHSSIEPFAMWSSVLGCDSPLWHLRACGKVASVPGCVIFHSVVFSSVWKTPLERCVHSNIARAIASISKVSMFHSWQWILNS